MHTSVPAKAVPDIVAALDKFKEDTVVKVVAIMPFELQEGVRDELTFYEGDNTDNVALRFAMARNIDPKHYPTVLRLARAALDKQEADKQAAEKAAADAAAAPLPFAEQVLKGEDAVFDTMLMEQSVQINSIDYSVRVFS